MSPSFDWYDANSKTVSAQYEEIPADIVHGWLSDLCPDVALSKFHQVLRDEHSAGKVLLNFLNTADVIIIEMCQYHRLDVGARRQFSDFVGQQMLLDVVAK
jgi:hypothetical protein